MSWMEWLTAVAGLLAIFVTWDLVFCGGQRCGRATDGEITREGSAPGRGE